MIVVTGGAGFIGRALVRRLRALRREVVVVDTAPPEAGSGVEWLDRDIRDRRLPIELAQRRVSAVIHLAARASVTAYGPAAVEAEPVNVGGTLAVLEACRLAEIPRFVLASSAAVYGDAGEEPIPEERPFAPRSAYGASKVAAEAYTGAYARATGLQVTILRPATVYGPGQRPALEGAACAAFADALARGAQGTIYGDGLQTRDYLFVEDAARAFALAATAPVWGGTYNISTGARVSIADLYRALAEAAGVNAEPTYGPERPGDIRHSLLDPGRIGRELGWRAEVPLAEGLVRTVAWVVGKGGGA